jgi:hypothetical protein
MVKLFLKAGYSIPINQGLYHNSFNIDLYPNHSGLGVMKLVQDGEIDLMHQHEKYLRDGICQPPLTQNEVTIRRLFKSYRGLSHTRLPWMVAKKINYLLLESLNGKKTNGPGR